MRDKEREKRRGRSRAKLHQQLDDIQKGAESCPESKVRLAKLLRDDSGAMYLKAISLGTQNMAVPLESMQSYVKEFVEDAIGRDPAQSPLLRTLAEQVVLLHHTISRLHCEAVSKDDLDHRRTNIQLASTLTGELRRLTKELREQVAMSSTGPSPKVKIFDEKREGGKKRTG